MAKSVTKAKIGLEDIEVGVGTFNRTQSDGSSGTYTQLDLEDVPGSSLTLIDRASAPASPAANRAVIYTLTADDIARLKTHSGTVIALVDDTNAITIAGVKTFSSIPVLPASNPTTANQAVRKAYADLFALLAGATFIGAVNVSSGGLSDASRRVISKHTANTTEVSVTGTLAETSLIEITLAAGLLGTTGGIRVTAWGTVTGAAGTKRIRLIFGTTAIADTTAVSGTADWYIEAIILNDGSASVQECLAQWSDPTNTTNHNKDRTTAAENSANALTLKCNGTLGNAADTITQTGLLVEAIL